MPIFHINPDSGIAGRCRAMLGQCPFGGESEHYDTLEEAAAAYEKSMAEATIPAPASPLTILRTMSLKEMDPGLLSRTLQLEAKAAGMELEQIDSAIDLATILHAKQMRANRMGFPKTPYIEHPLRNSIRALRMGVKDQAIVIGIILHDTVEDGSDVFVKKFLNEKSIDEVSDRAKLSSYITKTYGEEVNSIVQAVTNAPDTVESKNYTNEEKAKAYREHVEENIKDNPKAYLVKIIDFIDNAGSLHHTDTPGNEAGTIKRAKKYQPVVNIFRNHMGVTNELISREARGQLKDQLNKTEARIKNILEKYDA